MKSRVGGPFSLPAIYVYVLTSLSGEVERICFGLAVVIRDGLAAVKDGLAVAVRDALESAWGSGGGACQGQSWFR